MQIGVVLPQIEIGADPEAIRAYASAVSDLGYDHVVAFDHVLGADPAIHVGWEGDYDIHDSFHEPLVLFGFLAGLSSLELVTGILILPQRQTALVAKQAAEVDVLSGGKLRLGVALGWNPVEYEALGKDFSDRGARLSEQVELMRMLWTEQSVTFSGAHECVTGAGISPLPVQRPIPVWFGGTAVPALRRAGRIADGWFPEMKPGPELAAAIAVVNQAAVEAGRDPATIGMEGRIEFADGDHEDLAGIVAAWREAGATHLSLNTMEIGLATVDDHIAALASAASVVFG